MASVDMEEAIADSEATIMTCYNNLIQEALGKYIDCDLEDLADLDDSEMQALSKDLSKRKVQFITKESVTRLKELDKEVDNLQNLMKNCDDELEKLIEDISGLIKKEIKEHDINTEKQMKIERGCGFLEKNYNRGFSFLERQLQRADIAAEGDDDRSPYRTLTLEGSLHYFASAFVKSVEEIFLTCAKRLNNKELVITLHPTIEGGIKFCSLIPKLKIITVIGEKLAKYIVESNIKKISKLPPKIINSYAQGEARIILIEAAYRIFSHYEYQFSVLEWKKYVDKLATDSAARYLHYLVKLALAKKISSEEIVKGVLEGKSAWNPNRLFGRGRVLTLEEVEITSVEFFTKTGISEKKENQIVHHASDDTLHDILKYRLKFLWDDLSDFKPVVYTDSYKYQYTKEKEKSEIEAISRYIDPKYKCKVGGNE